jgi:hypothetical protein
MQTNNTTMPGVGAGAEDTLTDDERRDLGVFEQQVHRIHEHGYVVTGTALLTIQERRLYRETHPTFEKYLQARLRMSRATAYRLMGAVEVVDGLNLAASEAGVSNLETPREGTIRSLVKIPVDVRPKVLAALVRWIAESGDRLTAGVVNRELWLVAPQYAGRRRAKTLDDSQRKLADPRLEALAHEVAALVTQKSIDYSIVLRRAAVLARKAAR